MKATVDRVAALLNTSDGKDKVLRTICYALQLAGDKSVNQTRKDRLFAIASQLSSARLVLRQLGDIPMLKYTWDHFAKGPAGEDLINWLCTAANNVIYQLYYPVEHIAYLGSHNCLNVDSSKWFQACTVLWAMALVANLIKTIRTYLQLAAELKRSKSDNQPSSVLRNLHRQQIEQLKMFVTYGCDFANAIAYLPKGILWSGTFPKWKIGLLGLIASLLGLQRMFERF